MRMYQPEARIPDHKQVDDPEGLNYKCRQCQGIVHYDGGRVQQEQQQIIMTDESISKPGHGRGSSVTPQWATHVERQHDKFTCRKGQLGSPLSLPAGHDELCIDSLWAMLTGATSTLQPVSIACAPTEPLTKDAEGCRLIEHSHGDIVSTHGT